MKLDVPIPTGLQHLFSDEAFADYTRAVPDKKIGSELNKLIPSDLFELCPKNMQLAKCCLSGLWLLHNFLDESHAISQNVNTPEGSWWHAIMHRLEGDFSNATFWYQQVDMQELFEVRDIDFDPFQFVDRCKQASKKSDDPSELHTLAVLEWKVLFEYCFVNGAWK